MPGATPEFAQFIHRLSQFTVTIENAGTINSGPKREHDGAGRRGHHQSGRALLLSFLASSGSISGSSSRFDNVGTFRKSVDGGTTTVAVTFNNY